MDSAQALQRLWMGASLLALKVYGSGFEKIKVMLGRRVDIQPTFASHSMARQHCTKRNSLTAELGMNPRQSIHWGLWGALSGRRAQSRSG